MASPSYPLNFKIEPFLFTLQLNEKSCFAFTTLISIFEETFRIFDRILHQWYEIVSPSLNSSSPVFLFIFTYVRSFDCHSFTLPTEIKRFFLSFVCFIKAPPFFHEKTNLITFNYIVSLASIVLLWFVRHLNRRFMTDYEVALLHLLHDNFMLYCN